MKRARHSVFTSVMLLILVPIMGFFVGCHPAPTQENHVPTFTTNLQATFSLEVGSSNEFAVAANDADNDALIYAWQESSNNGTSWTSVGSNSNKYVFSKASEGTWKIRVTVSDGMGGSAISTICTVTVTVMVPTDPILNAVYIAGYEETGSSMVPCYWKDEVKIDLPHNNNAAATSIYVSGSDVYVAGYDTIGSSRAPCYWKNGVKIDLPVRLGGVATSIQVSDSDVYVAGGYDDNNVGTYWGGLKPCYWKNGVKIDLPVRLGGVANSIKVSGSDVYVAGCDAADNSGPDCGLVEACYWKNGNITILPSYIHYLGENRTKEYRRSEAYSIDVSGSDVHIAGNDSFYAFLSSDGIHSYFSPTYWSNCRGVTHREDLPCYTSDGEAHSIDVSGSDVYIAGNYYYSANYPSHTIPCYWKNGARTDLQYSGTGKALSIFLATE